MDVLTKRDKPYWACYIIIILGFILRVYSLGKESLWYDEVETISRMSSGLFYLLWGDHIGPLYYIILRFWGWIFGISEISVRFPSVIFSVGTLVLTYKISALLFNRKIGLLSVFFMVLSPAHIFYSQDATYYSLLLFLVSFMNLFFIKLIREGEDSIYFVFYTVSSILAVYVNILSVLILFTHNIILLFRRIRFSKKWLTGQFLTIFCLLCWFVPLIRVYIIKENIFFLKRISWIPAPGVDSLMRTFEFFCYGGQRYGGLDCMVNILPIAAVSLLFFFGVLFFVGLLPDKKTKFLEVSILICWIIVPIVGLLFISVFFRPLYVPRYVLFSLPAFYIIAAKGFERFRNIYFKVVLLACFTVAVYSPLNIYYSSILKMQWREASAYLFSNIIDGDIVVVSDILNSQMLGYYGRKQLKHMRDIDKRGSILRSTPVLWEGKAVYFDKGNIVTGVSELGQLKEFLAQYGGNSRGVWFLASRWFLDSENFPGVMEYLNYSFKEKKRKYFHGVNAYYYVHKG